MYVNRIGRKAPTSLSYILPVTKKDQTTALQLDENRDLKISKDESELVLYKQQPDQKWCWEPVRDMAELQNFMSQASTEEKQNHLGTWKDSKRFWVFPGDGIIQTKEVTTMKSRWQEQVLSKAEVEYDRDRGHDCAFYDYYSNVVPEKVAVKETPLATGKMWALEEPRRYVEAEVERVIDWKMTGDGWKPAETELVVYDAESRKDKRAERV
jgi:hypothetical protein